MKFFTRLFSIRNSDNSRATGFEPEEQHTPLMGKVLLLILAVVLVFFGWQGLNDIADIPEKPQSLSRCFVRVGPGAFAQGTLRRSPNVKPGDLDSFPTYVFETNRGSCNFSSFEEAAGVPERFLTARDSYNNDVRPLQEQVRELQRDLGIFGPQYETSLLERGAEVPPLRKAPEEFQGDIRQGESELRELEARLKAAETSFKQALGPLVTVYGQAGDAYERAWAWYRLKVFLLELIFAVPLFLVSFWFYRRLLAKSSPHTIIAVPIVGVAAFLLARVILVYFWSLFLADLIEFLWLTLGQIPLLRTFLYYLGMALAILVFGGAVYLLQKRIFAPERVRARRLRANKCPYCELSLDLTKQYCPGCGKQLLIKCPHCGNERYADLRICPSCGKE